MEMYYLVRCFGMFVFSVLQLTTVKLKIRQKYQKILCVASRINGSPKNLEGFLRNLSWCQCLFTKYVWKTLPNDFRKNDGVILEMKKSSSLHPKLLN